MHFDILQDLVLVFGTGIAVVLLSARLRLPSIVGFLLTGVLVGPHGLGLVRDPASVELLAEVGVIMLLFVIGAELSLAEMIKGWRAIVVGGSLQVAVTAGIATAVARALGQPVGTALLVGFIIALSSTAIVMRLLGQRAETTSPHGRVALGILIFQDLAVVPMMLLVPFLAGVGGGAAEIGIAVAKALAVVVLLVLVSRQVVPRLLRAVVGTRSSELFLLTILALCLGTAWATSQAELSLALGAFLAGLIISESEYSHQALGTILPFRDGFSCLFFVSVGMLLDLRFALGNALPVCAATLAILALKALIAGGVARVLGFPSGVAAMVGLLLSQVGEFSFLLLREGQAAGMLKGDGGQILVAATVLTMAATPAIALAAPRISILAALLESSRRATSDEHRGLSDHVIVAGYGLNGQNVARTLKAQGVPHIILEVNPDTVRKLRREGELVLHGSATQPAVLEHAGIARARVVVVTIPDAAAARQVVAVVRHLAAGAHLIVRTRFVGEVDALFRLGANEVVPEEFETSIELFSRVLRQYLVPRQRVEALARETRQSGYDRLRAAEEGHRPVLGLQRLLGGVEMEAYLVEEGSAVARRTLVEAAIKRASGALVLAVHRGHMTTPNPAGEFRLEVDDVVLLLGTPETLGRAAEMFRPAAADPEAT